VNSEGELWQRQRRTLHSHFHGSAIEPFVRVMDLETETTVLRWREAAGARPIDLETEMLDLLTRITSRGLFGLPLGDVVAKARLAFLRAARTSPLLGGLPSPAQWELSRQSRRLRRLVEDIIRDPPPEASGSLLPILAHARDPHTGAVMSERQLADELVTLLYTGLETSALTLTWFWYLLARNVDVEEEIRREAEVARAAGNLVPEILDASLHEVLRLYPPSWAIGREAIVPDEIEGFEVPAGSKLILSQYVVHRHPEFWTDPEEFRPERFRFGPPDTSREISYFPFGAGPRVCLGRELAEREAGRVAGRLLTEFHLRAISTDPAGIEPTVTLKPLRRIKMWVEPRT
jgi:cytochrome P450